MVEAGIAPGMAVVIVGGSLFGPVKRGTVHLVSEGVVCLRERGHECWPVGMVRPERLGPPDPRQW